MSIFDKHCSELTRREFVQFMGLGVGASTLGLSGCSSTPSGPTSLPFESLKPSSKDDLLLVDGLDIDILISRGDLINADGQRFGSNNDYTAVIPLGKDEAIMWVNHEYPETLFESGWIPGRPKNKRMVDKERESVGGSLIHIVNTQRGWRVKKDSAYNRRITGTTKIPFIADRDIEGRNYAIGTFGNCAGGVTPWNTILTCEENYHLFYGETDFKTKQRGSFWLGWEKVYDNPPEHYGWVVEVNPLTGDSKKLTGLGRFSHECATCVRTEDGKVAVYSGDDKTGEFLYKFISDSPDSLHKGELFVANLNKGEWVSLDIEKQPQLKASFKDQTEVLTYCRYAGRLVGATPLDRPEDIEIHPYTGDVYITLTNNTKRGNYHGSILRLREQDGYEGKSFKAEDFLVGGKHFSSPDNLLFDARGNMWMTTDISGSKMNKGKYSSFKNNGLFLIPTLGPLAGEVFQVASAPRDSEFTGLSLSPDKKSLFLSVQHPGEQSKSLKELTSSWPRGHGAVPLSSVVQIRGEALQQVIGTV